MPSVVYQLYIKQNYIAHAMFAIIYLEWHYTCIIKILTRTPLIHASYDILRLAPGATDNRLGALLLSASTDFLPQPMVFNASIDLGTRRLCPKVELKSHNFRLDLDKFPAFNNPSPWRPISTDLLRGLMFPKFLLKEEIWYSWSRMTL